MSATNRGGERVTADNYPTPSWCVRRLLEAVDLPTGLWIDPCAGDGAIVRAANTFFEAPVLSWNTIELRRTKQTARVREIPNVRHAVFGDFLTCGIDVRWRRSEVPFRVCITNPPYSLAEEVIGRSLDLAEWVVMLLRLNFLASEDRVSFMRSMPPDVYVLPNRPSFRRFKSVDKKTGKPRITSSDASEYAWFVWPPERQRAAGRVSVLSPTPLEDRRLTGAAARPYTRPCQLLRPRNGQQENHGRQVEPVEA